MKSWRFSRAIIRVAANIPYEDAQAAIDGTRPHDLTEAALRPALGLLGGAGEGARHKREPLELDLPERRVVLDEKPGGS
jgi:ribonuclease R